jgi:hypothetical protein
MTADQLLHELGLTMGLPGLRFDASQCARLMFDGKTALNFEHDAAAGCIHLYGTLAPLPAAGREALFQQLLQANLFGAQTGGATLAVDAAHHEVVLCRSVPLEGGTGAAFAAVVERFVAALEEWSSRLAGAAPAAGAPVSPPAGGFGAFLRG